MNQIVVYNGQSREKNLKLNDKTNSLYITSRTSVMTEIDVFHLLVRSIGSPQGLYAMWILRQNTCIYGV